MSSLQAGDEPRNDRSIDVPCGDPSPSEPSTQDIDGVQVPTDNARSIPFVLQKDDEPVDVSTDRTTVQSSTNLRMDTK